MYSVFKVATLLGMVFWIAQGLKAQDCRPDAEFEFFNNQNNPLHFGEIHNIYCDIKLNYDLGNYQDPNPETPFGVRLLFLNALPQDNWSLEDLEKLLYTEEANFVEANSDMEFEITHWKEGHFAYAMPIIVDNNNANKLSDFFEGNCIGIYTEFSIALLQYGHDLSPNLDTIGRYTNIHWPIHSEFDMRDYLKYCIVYDNTTVEVDYYHINENTIQMKLEEWNVSLDWGTSFNACDCNLSFGGWPIYLFFQHAICSPVKEGFVNEEICIPINVKNFISLTKMEWPLLGHKDSLEIVGIQNIHPKIQDFVVVENYFEDEEGYVGKLIRTLPELDTVNIPDDEKLFDICVIPQHISNSNINDIRKIHLGRPDLNKADLITEIIDIQYVPDICPIEVKVLPNSALFYDIEYLCGNNSDGFVDIRVIPRGRYDKYTITLDSLNFHHSQETTGPFILENVPEGNYRIHVMAQDGTKTHHSIFYNQVISRDSMEIMFRAEIDTSQVVLPGCGAEEWGEIAVNSSYSNLSYYLVEKDLSNSSGVFINLRPGKYTIEVTNEQSCKQTLSYELKSKKNLDIQFSDDLKVCDETSTVPFELEVSSNEYVVNFGSKVFNQNDTINLVAGAHQFAINTLHCELDTMVKISLYEGWNTTNSLPDTIVLEGKNILELGLSEDDAVSEIFWRHNENIIGQGDSLIWTSPQSGIIEVSWEFGVGCHGKDTIYVLDDILPPSYSGIDLPNVFDPSIGEYYIPIGGRIARVDILDIYDRWGNKLYSQHSDQGTVNNGWDGLIDGKPVSAGVYVIFCRLRLTDGTIAQIMQNITVLN